MCYLPFFRCLVGLPTGPAQLVLPLGKSNTFPFTESWALQCLRYIPRFPRMPKWEQGYREPPWAQEQLLFPPLVSAAPKTGCNSSLCGCSPPQKITCSAPHCFSHSLLISVDLQALGCTLSLKWKSTEWTISAAFVLDILRLVLWHMIGVGKQKHKAAAPVYCEQAVLSTSAFLFMSRHTTCQATWIRN